MLGASSLNVPADQSITELKEPFFSPQSSLQDLDHYDKDVCVFLSRPQADSLERATGLKGGKNSLAKAKYEDNRMITLGINGKQIAQTGGMSGKCHIRVKYLGLVPCKQLWGM